MKLPIGIQDFEKIRTGGYLYIDKTEHVYRLASEGSYYFLSRPRRFGKSLLLSTIKALFLGKRELFAGLAIDQKEDWDWAVHPVMHLDLNTEKYDKPETLYDRINLFLEENEQIYGKREAERSLGTRFEGIIKRAYEKTGQRVVILVDEYDKPLLQAIGNRELQEEYRGTLKGFYGALKSMDGCIKFAMLTGVTKFGKVSVFSDLNNLRDISLDYDFHSICGITEQELLSYFPTQIDALAERSKLTREECIEKLRRMYDGYHFDEDSPGMYNPFSVLNTFQTRKFGSYWFETGTPTYLVELLRRHYYDLEEMATSEVTSDVLNSIDAESTNPIPVIYQSGYLTIKGYKSEFKKYILGFPNEEVAEGFIKYLAPFYLDNREQRSVFDIEKFTSDVRGGKPEQFLSRLKSLFASAPYDSVKGDKENHFQNMMWVVFKMMGFYSQTEYHTSDGRIDLLVETPQYRYIMEFKLDGTAEEALQQIKDKNYQLQFFGDSLATSNGWGGAKTFIIGVNFSKETRTIDKWIIE
ncbi:MAG: ATP-binding protein [Prevotella sp.]|nr:ATP-binding protein [Prevotella sp.]